MAIDHRSGKEGRRLAGRLRDALALGVTRAGAALRDLRLPVPPPARLVFHPDYVDFPREAGPRYAFDVRRPVRILERLNRLGLLSGDQVLAPEQATRADLGVIHTPAFLDEISDPRRLAELLHLRADQVLMDNPLAAFLRQTGGTILAAERALLDGVVTFNLGGGFHHAQRDRAEGFCPVNDVAVAIDVLRRRRMLVRRVLVVDLDYHHGNGTALIFSRDEDVFTLSVHGQSWARIEGKRNNLDLALPPGTEDARYLAAVREALDEALGRFSPDLAIYLAGADPAAGDGLGDFAVSEQGLLERDLHVWRTLDRRDIPVAVVLAGGYGPLAWTIPYNFIFSVLTGTPIRARFRPSNIAAQYWRIHTALPVEQLIADNAELTAEEVLGAVQGDRDSARFLDFYSKPGLEMALERYGLLPMLRERGFDPLTLTFETKDRRRHLLRVHFGDQCDAAHLLIELAASLGSVALPDGPGPLRPVDASALAAPETRSRAASLAARETCRVLNIEWLCMQNPREDFSLERPPLPGQRYPGLGVARWIVELLRLMAIRLDCDGLMNSPDHYHNAFLYAKLMRYVDPADEGQLLALNRDLGHLSLLEATLAVDEGRVRRAETGEIFRWEGRPQVLAIGPVLREYVHRATYRQLAGMHRDRQRFEVVDAPAS